MADSDSRASSATSKASRWAAALANVANNNNNNSSQLEKDYDDTLAVGRRTELVCKKSEHIHVVKDIRPPTQGNKWPRISTTGRPETIEEIREPLDQ